MASFSKCDKCGAEMPSRMGSLPKNWSQLTISGGPYATPSFDLCVECRKLVIEFVTNNE